MKRLLITTCLLLAFRCAMFAVPAKPGMWQEMTTIDGETVKVELVGDEWMHYYRTADGQRFAATDDGRLRELTDSMHETWQQQARSRRARRDAAMVPADYKFPKDASLFQGKKKGLIILVEFSNNAFSMDNAQETYDLIANGENYSEGKFKKSVRDYFLEQSYGQFDLSFDVVGPVKLDNVMSYYGGNNEYGNDLRPGEMVAEACQAADEQVDFADYDWDGDGEVDQVFVLYAGYGEADGAPASTVWPHEWLLSEALGKTLTLDGVEINTYACGNELDGMSGKKLAGIGVFCHEFSHCMGFPDFYDNYNFGMGAWDLMSNGARNGNGYNPAEYTAYERMVCGWLQPIELKEDTHVSNLKPITDGGETYIIYCDNPSRTEYYLLENKDKDDIYPYNYTGKGLLVTHVDFDLEMWYYNNPNTTATYYRIDGTKGYNTHQRMTIVAADNSTKALGGYITDVYPIDETTSETMEPNNSLTATTVPAFTQYNGGDEAEVMEGRELLNIVRNADGTIDFDYHTTLVPDAVKDVKTTAAAPYYYDLQGNRLANKPTRKGIYIMRDANGTCRKVL